MIRLPKQKIPHLPPIPFLVFKTRRQKLRGSELPTHTCSTSQTRNCVVRFLGRDVPRNPLADTFLSLVPRSCGAGQQTWGELVFKYHQVIRRDAVKHGFTSRPATLPEYAPSPGFSVAASQMSSLQRGSLSTEICTPPSFTITQSHHRRFIIITLCEIIVFPSSVSALCTPCFQNSP